MSDNGRISMVFICNLVLYFLLGELNFLLGSFSLHFHADTLLVVFFGLYLARLNGLIGCALLGFLVDSMSPAPYGTYVAGYLSIWLIITWGRKRIRRQNHMHVRALAAATQVIWMLALTVILLAWEPVHLVNISRIGLDIMFSALLTFLFAWRWAQFQKSLLYSLGWNIEAEMSKI